MKSQSLFKDIILGLVFIIFAGIFLSYIVHTGLSFFTMFWFVLTILYGILLLICGNNY